jgi:hypothetical protein
MAFSAELEDHASAVPPSAARLQRIRNQESDLLTPRGETADLRELFEPSQYLLLSHVDAPAPDPSAPPLRRASTLPVPKPSTRQLKEPLAPPTPENLPCLGFESLGTDRSEDLAMLRLRSVGTSGSEEPSTPRLQKASALRAQKGLQHLELMSLRHREPTTPSTAALETSCASSLPKETVRAFRLEAFDTRNQKKPSVPPARRASAYSSSKELQASRPQQNPPARRIHCIFGPERPLTPHLRQTFESKLEPVLPLPTKAVCASTPKSLHASSSDRPWEPQLKARFHQSHDRRCLSTPQARRPSAPRVSTFSTQNPEVVGLSDPRHVQSEDLQHLKSSTPLNPEPSVPWEKTLDTSSLPKPRHLELSTLSASSLSLLDPTDLRCRRSEDL